MTPGTNVSSWIALSLISVFAVGAGIAQKTTAQPVTDSSAQASPLTPAPKAPPTDDSAQASPIPPDKRAAASIPAHTALRVTLEEGVDSGHLKNGQSVRATLAADVPLTGHAAAGSKGSMLRAGSPAVLTVVGTVPAGKLNAVGEISLQLLHVGTAAVDTDILTFRGLPGHRDLPDSAPEVGTNAGLHAGMTLTFHVQPAPVLGDTSRSSKVNPGTVTAVASGSKASPDAGQIANSDPNQTNTAAPGTGTVPNGKAAAQSGQTLSQSPQNSGQPSLAPQTVSPGMPAGTAQPH